MMYATVEELRQRLDQRVVQYLSDDMELGVENKPLLEEILEGAASYVRAMVPRRFHDNVALMKELVLAKAIAMLYRRYGFFTEATTLDDRIASDIQQIINASVESGRETYVREPKYYAEEPIVDPIEWREVFEDAGTLEDIR